MQDHDHAVMTCDYCWAPLVPGSADLACEDCKAKLVDEDDAHALLAEREADDYAIRLAHALGVELAP